MIGTEPYWVILCARPYLKCFPCSVPCTPHKDLWDSHSPRVSTNQIAEVPISHLTLSSHLSLISATTSSFRSSTYGLPFFKNNYSRFSETTMLPGLFIKSLTELFSLFYLLTIHTHTHKEAYTLFPHTCICLTFSWLIRMKCHLF